MLRHLWALSKKADSLQVKWIHTCIIKGKCLWSMEVRQDSSWTVRKVFGLRELGQPQIQYRIDNGQSTFLWSENQHPLGPLYKRFGDEVVQNIGTLQDLFTKGLVIRWSRILADLCMLKFLPLFIGEHEMAKIEEQIYSVHNCSDPQYATS